MKRTIYLGCCELSVLYLNTQIIMQTNKNANIEENDLGIPIALLRAAAAAASRAFSFCF